MPVLSLKEALKKDIDLRNAALRVLQSVDSADAEEMQRQEVLISNVQL